MRTRVAIGLVGAAVVTAQQPAHAQTSPQVVSETYIGVELGAAEYEFGYVTSIAFIGRDLIAIADGMAKNVRVFTLDGQHRLTLGRRGGGPGEFVHPGAMITDSLLRVFDPMQHRLVVFDPRTGKHLSTSRLSSVPGANLIAAIPLGIRHLIGATNPAFAWGSPQHQTDVAVLDLSQPGTGDTIASFHQGLTVWYPQGARAPWGIVPSRFGAGGAWAVRDSTLALVDGYTGIVRFIVARTASGLTTTKEVRLPGSSRPVTAEDLSEVEDSARADARRAGAQAAQLGFEPPPRWSIGQDAFFADENRLWVLQETTPSLQERWTEITPDGVVRSFTFSPGIRIKCASLPYVAGVEVMESRVQRVVVYKLAGY